jgi:hypothetical protein
MLAVAKALSRYWAWLLRDFSKSSSLEGSSLVDRSHMTRIMLEGALNGIGFVIGSALVGLVLSIFLILAHHLITLMALPIIGVVLWVSFKGRRVVKARLERAKIGEFTRALGRQ